MRSSRPKFRLSTVNLGDDNDLRWVSLLPRGPINAHGTRWDFDAEETNPDELKFRWEDAVSSLERWLVNFAPPVAVEHDKNGTAAGYLRRVVCLTQSEAALLGIAQPVAEMLYGGLDLTSSRWASAFDEGEIPYVSPNIRAWASTELDEAADYPFAIGEVSFVTIPQIKAQQVPVAEMRGISLSEGDPMMTTMEECAAYCAEAGLDEAAVAALMSKLFPELHKAEHEANPELADEMVVEADPEALEGAALELQKAAQEIEETKKVEDATLSEVKRLKSDLAAARKAVALANVKVALGARKVSPATESMLADAFVAGGGKFEALLKDLSTSAPRPTATARTIAPMGRNSASVTLSEVIGHPEKFATLSEDTQWKLITELADREKCHPAFAASWITYGETPATVIETRATKGRF